MSRHPGHQTGREPAGELRVLGRTMTRPMVIALIAVAVAAVLALGIWSRPFAPPSDAAVGAGALVVLATRRVWRPAKPHRRFGWRWAIWFAPVGLTIGWEIANYASSPRSAHPTISSLLDTADATRPGRAVVFAAWLVLGSYLVSR